MKFKTRKTDKQTSSPIASIAGKLLPPLGAGGKKLLFLGDIPVPVSHLASITGSVLSQARSKKLISVGMR